MSHLKCRHPHCCCDDYCMAEDPHSTPKVTCRGCGDDLVTEIKGLCLNCAKDTYELKEEALNVCDDIQTQKILNRMLNKIYD